MLNEKVNDLEANSNSAGAAALEMAIAATLENGGRVSPCRNCAAPVMGAFCAACGQPTDTHRSSVLHLLHDLFADIASFDSRILRTARALFINPGELPLAFREGRTQRYVPAMRLYLFVSLIFFLFLSITDTAIVQLQLTTTHQHGLGDGTALKRTSGNTANNLSVKALFFSPIRENHRQVSPDLASVLQRQHAELTAHPTASPLTSWSERHVDRMLSTLATNPAAINGPMTEWVPRSLFILLPAFACVLALFYWRQRQAFYFVDHLVFSLNMHSFAFAIILVAIVMTRLVASGAIAEITLTAIAIYLLLAMKRFYKQGWVWTGAKFILVSLIYSLVFLTPALTGILLAGLLNI